MVRKILLTCITLLLLSFGSYAQNLTDKFQAKQFISDKDDTLNYRIHVPTSPDSTGMFPVVLFLHGAGERGSDNKAQLKWGVWRFVEDSVQQKHPSIVIAPQAPENSFWGRLERQPQSLNIKNDPGKQLDLVMGLLEKVKSQYKVDASRMYITGMSMGGFGTWKLLIQYPDTFAAAAPVCGGGDVTQAHKLTDIPIWNFHGALDNVVSPELSRDMIEAIRYAGGKPGYSEYPDVGHFSWIQAYREPYLVNWMFSQKKGKD